MSDELRCRLTGEPLRHVFVDLGMSPFSNSYVAPGALPLPETFCPLKVYVGENSLLVQLPAAPQSDTIFGNDYRYFSSYSESWLRHCERYAEAMIDRLSLDGSSRVVELASNDGYLLQYFQRRGVPVLGVEPSGSVAKVAREERGIPTVERFFGAQLAGELRAEHPLADLIVANNVLAHVPDLHDFVAGMKLLLAPRGVITIECPHLQELMEKNQFDTIYHEHFSYFSLLTLRAALRAHGLRAFDVDRLTTHGGSLRVYACHDEEPSHPVHSRVDALLEQERAAGLDRLETYTGFQPRVERIKRDLLTFLIDAKANGKRVVGYGAPAKGNTLLNYCGIRTDFIDFTVDRSPHKQGLYLPGTRIPVHEVEKIDAARPDYILILPWNLREEIMDQLAHVRRWGARFVIPIPTLEVV